MPSLVAVLKYLRDNPEWFNLNDVITATKESQTRAEKAIAKLAGEGIIECEGPRFRYAPTEKTEDFAQKFLGLYGKIIQGPQLELMVRGILSAIGHPSSYLRLTRLVEVLGKEGFDKEEVGAFIERENARGRIEKLHIIFTLSRPGSAAATAYQRPSDNSKWLRVIPIPRVPYPSPLAISTYYMSSSRDVSAEEVARLKEEYFSSNPLAVEEEYIMGNYPPELSEPAVKYLTSEKAEMLKALKDEAFQQWFGLRYNW
jgi:HEPN domain-containing protein